MGASTWGLLGVTSLPINQALGQDGPWSPGTAVAGQGCREAGQAEEDGGEQQARQRQDRGSRAQVLLRRLQGRDARPQDIQTALRVETLQGPDARGAKRHQDVNNWNVCVQEKLLVVVLFIMSSVIRISDSPIY